MRYLPLYGGPLPTNDKGQFGYRHHYECQHGHRFDDVEMIVTRNGAGYCPVCRSDELERLTGPATFKATRKTTHSMRNAA